MTHDALAYGPGTEAFSESIGMLRSARNTLVRMSKMVEGETGIRIVPSFMPDQCDGYGDAPTTDWTIRFGFDGHEPASVGGSYEELCAIWLDGPEKFHEWIGSMAIGSARESVRAEVGHEPDVGMVGEGPDDADESLFKPGANSVATAKVGLSACGYVISPAPVPAYMVAATFVAWEDDTLVLVAVTDKDDTEARKMILARDAREFLSQSRRDPKETAAMVIRVDGEHLIKEDVEI